MLRFRLLSLLTILLLSVSVSASPLHAQSDTNDESNPERVFDQFNPDNFNASIIIENPWSPMLPGTFWAYEGSTTENGESIPHRIEFTVTDLTKTIEGVNTVVAWIVDYSDGEIVEKEIAFYAQDDDGNIWYLGEYPEEYEGGEFVAAPAWIAGIEGAQAGIKMTADPYLGEPSYAQGLGPEVGWTDRAVVDQVGIETCVAFDCYEDVLVIAETSLSEQDAYQLKFYARDVGNIQVDFRGPDASQEILELVAFEQLTSEAMEALREEVLALEAHAYEVSENVYALTEPSVYMVPES